MTSAAPLYTPIRAAASSPSSSQSFHQGQPEHTLPGLANESPWNQKSNVIKYPALSENTDADVVVVGAGISGLTTALCLAKQGKRVVVLESRCVGGGQTGRTTAHIMQWWDDFYFEAIKMHGEDKARVVAESMRAARDWIEETSKTEGIECKFTPVDGFLYPHEPSAKSTLEKELEAAHKAGLMDVRIVDLGGGPEVGGLREVLLFPHCADFHPLMYLDGLAEAVVRHGGRIFEGTKYWTTEGDTVETDKGLKIACDAVVLATDSPINHNLAVHSRQMPYRTYAAGFLTPKSAFKQAQYWSTEGDYHYLRTDDWDENNWLVIVGGEDHKMGENPSSDPYAALEKHARERWPGLGQRIMSWNGMVLEPADMLHLHGKDPVKPGTNTYIITGDSGQGMTGGTIGGIVVSDLILGKANPWAAVYSPSRLPPLSSGLEIADEGLTVAESFAERVLPKLTLSYDLPPGSGAVVQKGISKVALYVDEAGEKHAYSAVCPHLGCLVHWNEIEKCFDCPCHGSQFSCRGELMNGPAKADLSPFDW